MGGAPSRETLVRHIVRDPRAEQQQQQQQQQQQAIDNSGANPPGDAVAPANAPSTSQQPEIILIPLIPDYFPSSTSPLFQQLIHVRREPTVSYYYRDARSTAAEHAIVHTQIGSDKDLYNWYMSLSEQRLMETDNELIALSRAGRVVSPVPCAVAFVYNTNAAPVGSVLSAAMANPDATTATVSADSATSPSSNSGGKRRETGRQKQHRRGKAGGGNGGSGGGGGGLTNGYMTIENTVRVPHHNLRVRIFGFVGDTRFCPPSMQPNQAAKLPMCLTIFLSKSAGGNHRAQVTLLAAHTYLKQLQEIGALRHIDAAGATGGAAVAANAGIGAPYSLATPSPENATAPCVDDVDPLASLRLNGGAAASALADADPYRDPYADPYADPYGAAEDEELPPATAPARPLRNGGGGGSNVPLDGLGSHSPAPMLDVAKETILRRPVEVIMHRADVPALCYVRELRARMAQVLKTASPPPAAEGCTPGTEDEEAAAGSAATNAANTEQMSARLLEDGNGTEDSRGSLRRLMQTVVRDEELHGAIDAESIGRVLLWASRFYGAHFERLVGGEAARLRQELAQRNLSENPLDGTLSLTEDEPRPPKRMPVPGDVWITTHDTYVEAADGEHPAHPHHRPEAETWKTVPAGTVLRYTVSHGTVDPATFPEGHTDPAVTARGAWRVSADEFTEDILLSLCRTACHASRRAPPTDEHWLLNRESGLPEGLAAGLLIWREPAAGQVVYYGTTPEFLKTWVQSGADVESAYRHQVKQAFASNGAAKPGNDAAQDAGESSGATGIRSTSITVTAASSSSVAAGAATVTSASKGLRSSYDNKSPANESGVSSGPRTGSGKGARGQGSGSSSMALYSVHTGFVCSSEPGSEAAITGGKTSLSSPIGQVAAITTTHRGEEHGSSRSSSTEATKTKVRRARTENAAPTAAIRTAAAGVPQSSLPTTWQRSVGQQDAARLSHSLPAHQRSHFAVPVASSSSLVQTPNSSTSSMSSSSRSYTNLGYVSQAGSYSGSGYGSGTPARAAHLSNSFAHPQQAFQQPSSVHLASACWIGVADPTSRDAASTPTVNVVVKQRRSVRLTPGTSLVDSSTMPGSSAVRLATVQSGSYSRAQPRSEVMSVGYVNSSTQPVGVGGQSLSGAGNSSSPLARGSLPINILGTRESSSEDGSFHHGGHSPFSQGQSRSLLRGGGEALLSHDGARGDANTAGRQPPRQSAAMDINSGGVAVGTPQESSASLRWTTNSAAQPAPMRGASVTFASGSARHQSLLHHSRYQEPCQPVLSRSASFSTAEVLGSSVSSSGSFSRKKEALRPPPLFPDDVAEGRVATAASARVPATTALAQGHNTPNGIPASQVNAAGSLTRGAIRATAPVEVAGGGAGAQHSRTNSAAHTPRSESLGDGAKSSAGSGKYRWDWRGVSWTS